MKDLSELKSLLGSMGRCAVPVDEADVTEKQRERVVSHVVHTIAVKANERRRAEQRKRFLGRTLVAALVPTVFGVTVGMKSLLSDDRVHSAAAIGTHGVLELKTRSATRAVSPGHAEDVATGDEVATENGGTARVTLPGGAALAVASATRLQLTDLRPHSQSLDLKRGFITVTVPKLGPDGSFTVTTPDARIVVHGTVFTVEVESPAPSVHWTTVTVSEGVVSVFHAGSETRLTSGGRWTSRRFSPAAETSTKAPNAVSVSAASPPAPVAPTTPSARASNDDLSTQNELFTQAVRARRTGDDRTALRFLRELLTRYPHAALEHEARVEELRALHRSRDASAAHAARRYLARYPDGFAADEARAILRAD